VPTTPAQPRDERFLVYGLPGAEEGGNEKTCGVLGVTSRQNKKSRHAAAPIASEGAPDFLCSQELHTLAPAARLKAPGLQG
jgi:hypothetical protein